MDRQNLDRQNLDSQNVECLSKCLQTTVKLSFELKYTYKVKTQKTMYIRVFFVSKGEGREGAYF